MANATEAVVEASLGALEFCEAAWDADERGCRCPDASELSDPALLTALNTLWTRGPAPFLLPQIRFSPVRALAGALARAHHAAGAVRAARPAFVKSESHAGGKPRCLRAGRTRIVRNHDAAAFPAAALQVGLHLRGHRLRALR